MARLVHAAPSRDFLEIKGLRRVWVTAMAGTDDIFVSLRTALPGLRKQWPIRSLALFGSRVRDDAKPDSDLDVLVEFDRPVALSSFLALEERLAAITGLRVDLVSAAALKPYIGERVRAEAAAL
jgi:predicted nucleotidyltransferase